MSHRPSHPKHVRGSDPTPGAASDAGRPVLAAGAICWRPSTGGGLELLLVRSARWDKWSWPKGKLERGETLPECAVREVAEETGAQIELGVPLPSVSYVLPDGPEKTAGLDKTVHYWAGRVRETRPRTARPDEIAEVVWLPIEAALERLSQPGDLAPVHELLELAEQGRLDTRPLLVVRHAKARGRARWTGTEADRPLTANGRRQAQGLAGLLMCWQPQRLLCSPWARCMLTLRPYLEADQSHLAPEVLPLLSEQGLRNDPSRIGGIVAELLADRRSALLCTHRPVLEVVFGALREAAAERVRERLPARDPWLATAEILVAHMYNNPSHGVTDRIHTVEQFRGESPRNTRT